MDESQVERKKSYRWVSATQATYDGAGWDSNSDGEKDSPEKKHVDRDIKGDELPSLPKLDYGDSDTIDNVVETPTIGRPAPASADAGEGTVTPSRRERMLSEEIDGDEYEDSNQVNKNPVGALLDQSQQRTPMLNNPRSPNMNQNSLSPSVNSSKSSFGRRPMPNKNVNDHLDDLMMQISKELTPKAEQVEGFGSDNESAGSSKPEKHRNDKDVGDSVLDNGSAHKENTKTEIGDAHDILPSNDNVDVDNMEHLEDRDGGNQDNIPSAAKHMSVGGFESTFINSYASSSDDEIHLPLHDEEYEQEIKNRSKANDNNDADDVSLGLPTSDDSDSDMYEFDDHDDALSFTESIRYATPNKELNQNYKSEPLPAINNESISHGNEKTVQPEIDGNEAKANHDTSNVADAEEDEDEDDEILNSLQDSKDIHVHKSGYFKKMVTKDSTNATDDAHKTEEDDVNSDNDSTNRNFKNQFIKNQEDGNKEDEGKTSDSEEEESDKIVGNNTETSINGDNKSESHSSKSDVNKEEEKRKSVESAESGDWRPDTDALRSGFLENTGAKPPPGFVRDEKGELVDLTPSSMKPRVVSTYSEVESSWNAFPSENNADLETIGDTKTIYDNNTLYNVPGIMTNNEGLPPLPETMPPIPSANLTPNTDRPVERKASKDGSSIIPPTSQELDKLSQQNSVPNRDLNKIIGSNSSHKLKLKNLRDYKQSIDNFDSGLQTWITYTLKSSSKTDRDFIFQEYKSNRHVREAYANADDLSRKNTVINTVSNVNQNVNHLRKKVLHHSLKPKTLFSSIGKKKL